MRMQNKLMKWISAIWMTGALVMPMAGAADAPGNPADKWFTPPERGFVSRKPAPSWEHALVTGNGIQGAMVMGNPCDETLHIGHSALYLPTEQNDNPFAMAKHVGHIRELCLAGKFEEAGLVLNEVRKECDYNFGRDTFIGGFSLQIRHPETDVSRYQRAVDFMTGEAHVAYVGEDGAVRRNAFVSRADDVVVVRIEGDKLGRVVLRMNPMPAGGVGCTDWPAAGLREIQTVAKSLKSQVFGRDGNYLRFQTKFAVTNLDNPITGYEAVCRMVNKGGWNGPTGILTGCKEIVLLIKVRPILKGQDSNLEAIKQELEALPGDYDQLLARHAKIHGDLMGRSSFSLNAPAADRAKPTEDLIKQSAKLEAPLAQIERAFDASRYLIISSTGYNPPNLQGLWAATWRAPWGGGLTVDGNLPCAIAFLEMGNTPELMERFFAFNERMMPGFRRNMKELYGMRGFHVPAQVTASPRVTDFSADYSLTYWHAGAPWFCQFYYDHWLCTGDRKFLEERCYPLLKEAAAFYEDFLTVTDKDGKLVFVPSYSPENRPPTGTKAQTCINATMDVGAAKQLLNHAIAAARELNCDAELQKKWAGLLAKMPAYQVGEDGSFREWLWPGFPDRNRHRTVSHLYALYDESPAEIVENPALVKALDHTMRERLDYMEKECSQSFGIAFTGIAAAHVGNAETTQRTIHWLARNAWTTGMGAWHMNGIIFNTDLGGGFPYLCASTLVYSDPGLIRFFPARPPQWKSGSIKGLRLRGAITLKELTWDEKGARAVLVSDKDQTITVIHPDGGKKSCELKAGKAEELQF